MASFLLEFADKSSDAERIKQIDGVTSILINGRHIVGIDREIKLVKCSYDDYINKLMSHIEKSNLSEPLKSHILSQIDVVEYKGLTVIRLRIPRQKTLSFIGKESYIRENSKTIKIEGPKLLAASKLFE